MSYARYAGSRSAPFINASRQIGNGNTTEPSPRCAAMEFEQTNVVWRHHVVQTFAVVGNKRIPVDEAADPVGSPIRDASDYHPAVAVPEEDHVPEIVLIKIVNDRLIASSKPTDFESPGRFPLIVGVRTV